MRFISLSDEPHLVSYFTAEIYSQMAPSIDKQIVVRFKDNRYSADQLSHQSSSGPMIEIGSEELHDNFSSMVQISPGLPPELLNRTPIFAKYEGKYVVLLGGGSMIDARRKASNGEPYKLKGRLLSNPMLKRCIA